MAFNGSLLAFSGDNFNLSYVFKESYSITPNRRQDLDSTRNANGVLVRNVLAHAPSTISLTTKPMWNDEMATMMNFIRSHYTSTTEKKLSITYYCPDIDSYQTGNFYVPDIEFPIMLVDLDNNKIQYKSITLEFIEY